ncbi:MAG TPA: response regulator, partial [Chthoniobacteraceae bacterium]|nr:response regulator [Chthoniobacteraceae bacterium]
MSVNEQKPIRVLVVDDSPTAAELLSHVLNSDRRLTVVEVATDGEQALEAAQRMAPDVITMDIHMPKVNGYEATRRIMETCPAPIVIVSGSLSAREVASNFR